MYIKREAARELIKNFGKGAVSDGKKTLDPVDDIILLASGVDLIPPADGAEIVRCKDCTEYGRCPICYFHIRSPYGFCSKGKRKEGKGEEE